MTTTQTTKTPSQQFSFASTIEQIGTSEAHITMLRAGKNGWKVYVIEPARGEGDTKSGGQVRSANGATLKEALQKIIEQL